MSDLARTQPLSFVQEWRELEYYGIMEPDTVSECEARLRRLAAEVEQCHVKLGQIKAGKRDLGYDRRRGAAVEALSWKVREVRSLKDWRRRALAASHTPSGEGSTGYYLKQTLRLIGRILEREGVQLSSIEQNLLREATAHLESPSETPRRRDAI